MPTVGEGASASIDCSSEINSDQSQLKLKIRAAFAVAGRSTKSKVTREFRAAETREMAILGRWDAAASGEITAEFGLEPSAFLKSVPPNSTHQRQERDLHTHRAGSVGNAPRIAG
jgi:hypothetical protein